MSTEELVYAKILQLISLLKSMTRFRASVKFCDIHRGNKHSDWLRAMVTLIMTFTGIAGDTNLKFFEFGKTYFKVEKQYHEKEIFRYTIW